MSEPVTMELHNEAMRRIEEENNRQRKNHCVWLTSARVSPCA